VKSKKTVMEEDKPHESGSDAMEEEIPQPDVGGATTALLGMAGARLVDLLPAHADSANFLLSHRPLCMP
jgi:hypothetical protein